MVLLWLMLLPTAFSAGSHSRKNYTIEHVDSCPAEGYFVQRELAPNSLGPGPCFLCFCQLDGTATCWRREDWRCDVEKNHYHHVGKREIRLRRTAGLSDIFFRDATRDVFNKNVPAQCKPFESSFSDGCPPVDWCIGCTVCDCDANGHWDCHVLSFCDKTTKKPTKKRRANYRRTVVRRPTAKPKITATVKPSKKPQPKVIKKVIKKPANLINRTKRQPPTRKNVHKPQPKNINTNKSQKIIRRRAPPKKIIKKDVTKKPVEIKDPNQIVLPTTPKFAQAVVKQVLDAVKNLMRHDIKKGNTSKILNAVEKNQPGTNRQQRNTLLKRFSNILTQGARTININSNNNKRTSRNKRNIVEDDSLKVISVVPIDKDDISSINIIPIRKFETTTEHTVNTPAANITILNETLPTNLTVQSTTVIIPLTTVSLNIPNATEATTAIGETTQSTLENVFIYTPTTIRYNTTEAVTTITESTTTTEKHTTELKGITDTMEANNGTEKSLINVLENMTEANDLKFDNWAQIKTLKDREKQLRKELLQLNMQINRNTSSNDTFIGPKLNIHSQNITRKIDIPKKNVLKKIIVSPKMKVNKDNFNASYLNKKVSDIQNVFKNVLKEVDKNTTKVNSYKQFNIIKYMKKLFGKLLRKGKNYATRTQTELFLDKHHTLNMLCENIGRCKIKPKDRRLLDSKLSQLSMETNNILKIVKVIKGLLHLVEIPLDNQTTSGTIKNVNNDVDKLNIILRESYFNELKLKSLSQTQETQIDYIRKNTQEFIHSVAKFAKILNDIIYILKDGGKTLTKRKLQNKFNHSEAFRRLKHLLVRYDMMQNSFFKKIYNSLTNFESKLKKEKQKQNSMDKELKNMATINNFSRNIITNLRKLTQLAQNMNSRPKRETKKDNEAVEYLLMLMEFLLKQNQSLDVAPANDGIDLLIDAIKNAPNIKPIKKKVLQYIPAMTPTRTVPVKVKKTKLKKKVKTTTVTRSTEVTSKLDDPKFVEPVEEDRDYEDRFLYTRRSVNSRDEETSKNEASTVSSKKDSYENAKESDSEGVSESKVDKYESGTVEKIDVSINKLNKNDSKESAEKRYDIFNADLSDVVNYATLSSPLISEATDTTTEATPKIETSTMYDKKRLEWVDETYDGDVTVVPTKRPKPQTTTSRSLVTRTKKATSKLEKDVSAISKEKSYEVKGKSTKSNKEKDPEQVIYKKQMDLLNSLDYVTEKTEFDTESKEGEEPYPAYFV